jgi:hypothetical protein
MTAAFGCIIAPAWQADGMASNLTKDQQVRMVCDGLALGTMALGVTGLANNKFSVEMSLADAWRTWPESRRFPSIANFEPENTIWLGMYKSASRKWTHAAWDFDGPWVSPFLLRQGWDSSEALGRVESDSGVTSEAWTELARLVVDGMDEDKVRREHPGRE